MSNNVTTKHILYIENEKKFIEVFEKFIERNLKELDSSLKIKSSAVRHIEAARKLLISERKKFDALIVDLMLPRNKEELKRLERLERERKELFRELTDNTDYDSPQLSEEIMRLRKKIDTIDSQIDKCLDIEGGYNILKELAEISDGNGGKDKTGPLEMPVIFFTARSMPEIRERCKNIVHPDYFRWFGKPADRMKILKTLVELLKANPTR